MFPERLETSAIQTIGSVTIARDRFDYTDAVADSWKRRMLIKIVTLRYGERRFFLM